MISKEQFEIKMLDTFKDLACNDGGAALIASIVARDNNEGPMMNIAVVECNLNNVKEDKRDSFRKYVSDMILLFNIINKLTPTAYNKLLNAFASGDEEMADIYIKAFEQTYAKCCEVTGVKPINLGAFAKALNMEPKNNPEVG